ncbi:MAG: Ig-like domain-containing protein [Marinicellaceae bacterium]
MKITTKKLLLTSTLASFLANAGPEDDVQSTDQLNFAYTGDQTRLGIGITEEGELIGDFLKSFNGTYRTNWMAQAWASDGAGGIELDYHWIVGAESELDLIEKSDQLKVNKLFLAIDQNHADDRKITLGGGQEIKDKFWSLNLSSAITGDRLVSETSEFDFNVLNGTIDGIDFIQDQTIETITRNFESPYDWGVGGRLGKYFDSNLVRLTGGLDYESGEFDSDQLTASVDVEKYFSNTGHSLALSVRQLHKGGMFETDNNDTRAYLMWRYDFGTTYQPTERFEEVKVVDEDALARLKEQRKVVIQNEIDLSSVAFFDLNSYKLRDETIDVLKDLVGQIKSKELGSKITIVGHTCSIYTEEYNQTLSENRANAARDYFVSQGIDANIILSSGKGELDPKFNNDDPLEQPKNRRVTVSFLTLEKSMKEVEIPAEDVPVKWVKKPVEVAPSWLSRALNNPAKHKRTVDVYKFQEQEQIETLGEVVLLNQAPSAINDELTVLRNSSATLIDVLDNDSDPDSDSLSIIDVVQPANGAVINNGNSLTYTPNTGYVGIDVFEYTVDDGNGKTASAQVNVTVVNNAPQANDDVSTANGSDPLLIDVINNDTDSDGDTLIVKSVTQPSNGSVINNEDGTVTYQANDGYVGSDSFNYVVSDFDGDESSATVNVNVLQMNNPPVAVDDMYDVAYNGSWSFNPLLNDTDLDGDVLSVESVDTSGLQGTLTVNADGSMNYQAPVNFSGNDVFTYTVIDGNGGYSTATVTMCVAD